MQQSVPPSHPPLSNQSEKANTILLGALEVFATQGYAAASMDRIAKTAGVSKPTLYTYFNSKEGLFIALIQQMMQISNQMLANLPMTPEAQAPPDEVLLKLATSVLEEFSKNQMLLTLMRIIIGESGRFPELSQTFVREIQKPLLTRLVTYIASQPQLSFPDPLIAAQIFVGSLVHYTIIQHVLDGGKILPMERDRIVNGLVQVLMAAGKSM
ncbi:MAG: TetR/AcrR family transcriptional regulator [Phormidesmis sp.]